MPQPDLRASSLQALCAPYAEQASIAFRRHSSSPYSSFFSSFFSVHQRPQSSLFAAHKYVIAPASSSSFGSSARTPLLLNHAQQCALFFNSLFIAPSDFCSFSIPPLPQRPSRLFCQTARRLNPFLAPTLVICSRNLPRPICAPSCANLSPPQPFISAQSLPVAAPLPSPPANRHLSDPVTRAIIVRSSLRSPFALFPIAALLPTLTRSSQGLAWMNPGLSTHPFPRYP
ncbi:hypothetical protein C8Q70DRAFT_34039 [Cubamyces menziesii]|nr:hypothetical protein C8Q70DRAFT_34039 [Cubamyces menziesii]